MFRVKVFHLHESRLVEAVGLVSFVKGFMEGEVEFKGEHVTLTAGFTSKGKAFAFVGAVVKYLAHPVESLTVEAVNFVTAASREAEEMMELFVEATEV